MSEPLKFTDRFGPHASIGDEIKTTIRGLTVTARIVQDDRCYPPWDNEDGHGPVSVNRDPTSKRPGERVLYKDERPRERCILYDYQAAIAIAKRDNWDAPPYGEGTKGQRAARAVEADFKYLKAWCNDEWFYVGIVLTVSKAGVTMCKNAASLWGIGLGYYPNEPEYLNEVADELLPEAIAEGERVLESLVAPE